MNLSALIDRMVAAGMSAGDAGDVAAQIYAAGVASASVRTSGAERTRRWRESKASQSVTKRHETSPRDGEVGASQNVTERHKASQSDVSPVLHREKNIKSSSMQRSERPSRGTRIPSDWEPSPADRDIARQEGLSETEIDREALRFRDYWTGRAGSGGVKLDWAATWRNWVRTTAEKLGKTPRPSGGAPARTTGFYAADGSEERDAWDAYGKQKAGKTFPRDKNGGWWFEMQWPPGYKPQTEHHNPPAIKLQPMSV